MTKRYEQKLSDLHDPESRAAGKEVFEQIGCSFIDFVDEKKEGFKRRVDILFNSPEGSELLVDVEHKMDHRWYFENISASEYPFPFNTLDFAGRKMNLKENVVPSDVYVSFNRAYNLAGIARKDVVQDGKRYQKYDRYTKTKEYYNGAAIAEVLWIGKNKAGQWLSFESVGVWKPFVWDVFANYLKGAVCLKT